MIELARPLRPRTTADLRELIGADLGATTWHHVTQEDIDRFADLTGDHQWIHVDPVRAAESEFGSTIAHGLFGLSLGPGLMEELIVFDGFAHSLNYGYDKVRFPSPLPVGSRIRMRATVSRVDDLGTAANIVISQRYEREGADKPFCVAEQVARLTEHATHPH
ncbi:MaoC family dehydratase [Aeromicrobium chenweiae]|uniref:Enoyl-CoA hydratase n=1 Tax=Aeromicrobium chenweiae TaxID=2079793 RepID=A0A2S0WI29_9ACTN|nr:MaoC family dehydratase [Aeromicrobium chenweiae]AWB90942.1 enoyl-CoA hydratase [Aeromicrobium chenweiae]TGN32162.1 MaoC family dehydratase [Aeromicrobium chenweiae]